MAACEPGDRSELRNALDEEVAERRDLPRDRSARRIEDVRNPARRRSVVGEDLFEMAVPNEWLAEPRRHEPDAGAFARELADENEVVRDVANAGVGRELDAPR